MKTSCLITIIILFTTILTARAEDRDSLVSKDTVIANTGLKKMSLCTFDLIAGSNTAPLLGGVGAIYDAEKNANDRPYILELRTELINVSEEVLNEDSIFQYIPIRKLTYPNSDKKFKIDTLAKNNDLFICLSVQSSFGVCVGMQKKVNMTTIWKILCSSGYKAKIKTYSISKETHGVFPDPGDPKLKPVWLDLEKENANQFIEQFNKLVTKDKNLQ
jgi:hypothetical protein